MKHHTQSGLGGLLASVILLLCLPLNAHAYIDPGTGSFVFQMVVAGLLGALMYIKMAWQSIKLFFISRFSGNRADDDKNEVDDKPES